MENNLPQLKENLNPGLPRNLKNLSESIYIKVRDPGICSQFEVLLFSFLTF